MRQDEDKKLGETVSWDDAFALNRDYVSLYV